MRPFIPRGRRDGFTLIEMLVVIAIISLLMGLLLPAIQKVREAANRASCANNLKQITLALHHYELNNGQLPPFSMLSNGGATWAVLILPYMEQDNLYRQWDVTRTYYEQSGVARQTPVKNYFCPTRRSSTTSPRLSISGDQPSLGNNTYGSNVPGALGDYACSVGPLVFM
jgi:prepilin-type N-terminal cleavage/methylation domain-containing protein